jgi:hypothetical protein
LWLSLKALLAIAKLVNFCLLPLYQWGRAKDGHESRGSGATTTLASSITGKSAPIRTPARSWQFQEAGKGLGSITTLSCNDGSGVYLCLVPKLLLGNAYCGVGLLFSLLVSYMVAPWLSTEAMRISLVFILLTALVFVALRISGESGVYLELFLSWHAKACWANIIDSAVCPSGCSKCAIIIYFSVYRSRL